MGGGLQDQPPGREQISKDFWTGNRNAMLPSSTPTRRRSAAQVAGFTFHAGGVAGMVTLADINVARARVVQPICNIPSPTWDARCAYVTPQ